MAQKTSSYFISLLLCLLAALPAWAQGTDRPAGNRNAQVSRAKEKKAPEVVYPLYNGIALGIDLWGAGGKLMGSDHFSSELSASANLKNRFFPTVELGYSASDVEGDLGISYKSNAPFFRIGMDYNALYKKKHGHRMMVGMRYGCSSFKYDIRAVGLEDPIYGGIVGNPNLEDGYWGGSLPYDHAGMKSTMHWFELCFGIQAQISKKLYMGWALRMKYKLSASTGEFGNPYHVPGFGKYGSNNMGVTYSIIYQLPF